MTSVTGLTAEQAARIKESSVISAFLSVAGDLILVTNGGTQVNVGPIANNYSTTELRESIRTLKSFDTIVDDVTIPDWFTTGVSNPSVSLSAPLPGIGSDVAWSPDGNYIAFGHAANPYISIYKITKGFTNDTFTKLAAPASIPNFNATTVDWSPDGQYLAVGNTVGPVAITVYRRSGDVFTNLLAPIPSPQQVNDAAWSPDGRYLAVGTIDSPYYSIYRYTHTTDSWAKLAPPSLGNLGSTYEVAWSNGGQYLALGTQNQKFCILKRDGDTFTKLPDPASMPTGIIKGVCFSPNDQYFVATSTTGGSSALTIYKRTGDTFTELPDPTVMPLANGASNACWSPDGKYLVVTANGVATPTIVVYSRTNDTFTSVTPLPASLLNDSKRPTFSPDGRHLAMVSSTTPFYSVNKSSMKIVNEPQISTRLVP